MEDEKLSAEDLEYVADMLRAVSFFRANIDALSTETREELGDSLKTAEAALRRAISEIDTEDSQTSKKS